MKGIGVKATNNTNLNKQERTYTILRERIVSGSYSPGHRLVIDALARELGVSQAPIREALRRLESEGWVIYQRNVGPQVAPIDLKQWEQEMIVLAWLEGCATVFAAPHIGPETLSRLRYLNTEMQKALHAVDVLTFSRLNEEFHEAIYACCPNTYLVELLQGTLNRLDAMRRTVFIYIPERGWDSLREHTQLIDLLERHAPAQEIEMAAREHKLHTIEAYKQNKDRVLLATGTFGNGITLPQEAQA
ncbi:MAG: GntR family transcriptional regulator [Chloroflexi bacterium]|nr:GntR family transcriptional regulator [Chloroflexota bacterium]